MLILIILLGLINIVLGPAFLIVYLMLLLALFIYALLLSPILMTIMFTTTHVIVITVQLAYLSILDSCACYAQVYLIFVRLLASITMFPIHVIRALVIGV